MSVKLTNKSAKILSLADFKFLNEQKKYDSGMHLCPYCGEEEDFANEGPPDMYDDVEHLDITCHGCGNHWVECYIKNKCIEIILYDIKGELEYD